MDRDELQELIEGLVIETLDGGLLAGKVFRHNDAQGRVVTDTIVATANAPTPLLDGPLGFRIEVEIEMRSKTPTANSALHGEAMARLLDANILSAAALAVGFVETDDLYLLNEEISGDRSETKNLRKRTITLPFIFMIGANEFDILTDELGVELTDELGELLTA